MTRSREAMLRLFRVSDNRAAAIEAKPAIFPGYVAPIVRKAADASASSSTSTGALSYCRRVSLHGA